MDAGGSPPGPTAGPVEHGSELDIGPGVAYLCEPRGEPARPGLCVLLAHDEGGFRSGRHRQLADAFAAQGWLAFLPDFGAPGRPGAEALARAFARDFLLPWLENRGVLALQCVGFGTGALACVAVAEAAGGRLQEEAEAPVLLGVALAQPALERPHVRDREALQRLLANVERPLLVLAGAGSGAEVRAGGRVQQLHRARGLGAEVVQFDGAPAAFMTQGDLAAPGAQDAFGWALELCCEFLHRHFVDADECPGGSDPRAGTLLPGAPPRGG